MSDLQNKPLRTHWTVKVRYLRLYQWLMLMIWMIPHMLTVCTAHVLYLTDPSVHPHTCTHLLKHLLHRAQHTEIFSRARTDSLMYMWSDSHSYERCFELLWIKQIKGNIFIPMLYIKGVTWEKPNAVTIKEGILE